MSRPPQQRVSGNWRTLSGLLALVALISQFAARFGGVIIVLCALLIAAEVLLRNVFGLVILNSFELSVYGFAAALAFGFAYALIERAHIRIDILYVRLPNPLQAVIDAAAAAGMAVLATAMAWHAWSVVSTSARLGAVSNSTLQLPLVIPQSLWATGLSWFALTAALVALHAFMLLCRGRLSELVDTLGAGATRDDNR